MSFINNYVNTKMRRPFSLFLLLNMSSLQAKVWFLSEISSQLIGEQIFHWQLKLLQRILLIFNKQNDWLQISSISHQCYHECFLKNKRDQVITWWTFWCRKYMELPTLYSHPEDILWNVYKWIPFVNLRSQQKGKKMLKEAIVSKAKSSSSFWLILNQPHNIQSFHH